MLYLDGVPFYRAGELAALPVFLARLPGALRLADGRAPDPALVLGSSSFSSAAHLQLLGYDVTVVRLAHARPLQPHRPRRSGAVPPAHRAPLYARFYRQVRRSLAPGGVAAISLCDELDGQVGLAIAASATAVFDDVLTLHSAAMGMAVLYTAGDKLPFDEAAARTALSAADAPGGRVSPRCGRWPFSLSSSLTRLCAGLSGGLHAGLFLRRPGAGVGGCARAAPARKQRLYGGLSGRIAAGADGKGLARCPGACARLGAPFLGSARTAPAAGAARGGPRGGGLRAVPLLRRPRLGRADDRVGAETSRSGLARRALLLCAPARHPADLARPPPHRGPAGRRRPARVAGRGRCGRACAPWRVGADRPVARGDPGGSGPDAGGFALAARNERREKGALAPHCRQLPVALPRPPRAVDLGLPGWRRLRRGRGGCSWGSAWRWQRRCTWAMACSCWWCWQRHCSARSSGATATRWTRQRGCWPAQRCLRARSSSGSPWVPAGRAPSRHRATLPRIPPFP